MSIVGLCEVAAAEIKRNRGGTSVRRDNHRILLQMMGSLCLVLAQRAFTPRAKKLTRVKVRNHAIKLIYFF